MEKLSSDAPRQALPGNGGGNDRFAGMNWNFGADSGEMLSDPELFEGVRGRRVMAFLIDAIILFIVAGVLTGAGWVVVVFTFGLAAPLLPLALTLLPFAYHTWMIGSPGHATFGMRAMGLRVSCWNGNDPELPQALLQTVLFYGSILMTNFLVLLVSLFNERGRCLHDYLSGCVVINDVRRARLNPPSGS
jgi:uncharacterized RDD family membrane protein YckC